MIISHLGCCLLLLLDVSLDRIFSPAIEVGLVPSKPNMLRSNERLRALIFILYASISSSVSLALWRKGVAKSTHQRGVHTRASRRLGIKFINCLTDGSVDEYEECHYPSSKENNDPLLFKNEQASKSLPLNLLRGGNTPKISAPIANIGDHFSTKKRRNKAQSQRQVFQSLQRKKLIELHKKFRRKQRQFQYSLYALNSQSNPYFPKPPYNLWRVEPQQRIGKTTLTGKIFMLNIAAFALQTAYPALTAWGAKRSDLLLNGQQLHRLVTPIFLHGGIGHLMANSYSLKSMGMNVERSFGPTRFLAVYFASGIVGNMFSAVKSPNPAVGASGAIFGLVGAYYTFLSRNEQLFGYSAQMQQSALLETIGMNLLLGMTNPMIDNWGHIGGFVGGVGMSYLFGPKLYLARVPAREDTLDAGGFGIGKVVIDRPTIAFRLPELLEESYIVVQENLRYLGMRLSGILDNDGKVYKLVQGDHGGVELPEQVNVTPMDGLRQNVSELDRANPRKSRGYKQPRPKNGRSLRPRYGHLYR